MPVRDFSITVITVVVAAKTQVACTDCLIERHVEIRARVHAKPLPIAGVISTLVHVLLTPRTRGAVQAITSRIFSRVVLTLPSVEAIA
jgi:hypothetical protein